jgi:hypothetical protein
MERGRGNGDKMARKVRWRFRRATTWCQPALVRASVAAQHDVSPEALSVSI